MARRTQDALHRPGVVAVVDRAVVETGEVAARPEIALEGFGLGARVLDRIPLHEDVVPRHEGDAGEQDHDGLHDRAGVEDQVEDGKILGDVHVRASSFAVQEFGNRRRRHPAEVDAGDLDRAGSEFLAAAADVLAEDDADPASFFRLRGRPSADRRGGPA
jgi:hypothetical protein